MAGKRLYMFNSKKGKGCVSCAHKDREFQEFPCNECSDCDMYLPKEQTIKDSGERREFETGAVRDMSAGKGRMDLLPWAAII